MAFEIVSGIWINYPCLKAIVRPVLDWLECQRTARRLHASAFTEFSSSQYQDFCGVVGRNDANYRIRMTARCRNLRHEFDLVDLSSNPLSNLKQGLATSKYAPAGLLG